MRDFFAQVVPWATIAFAASSMFGVGLGHSARKILGPLRHKRRVFRALAANFLFAPALAYLLVHLLGLEKPLALGLILAGTAAGAPFLLKLSQAAGGDVALAATALVLLLPITVLYLPVALPLLVPEARVSATAIARPLVLSMLVPLGAGVLLRHLAPRLSAWAPFLSRFASFALVVLFASIFIADWQVLRGIGAAAVFAACMFLLGAFAIGWSLGGRDPATRDVVALATAQRNIGAATVVATQTFAGVPGVVVMVSATAVLGMLLLFPIALLMRTGAGFAPSWFPRRRQA
jgi:predicted Na+-dependent transporter